ncbi:MAG TPA: hypothetical protein VGP72_34005 [Planctomycetota bacterium]|jgi:hypothetical protein
MSVRVSTLIRPLAGALALLVLLLGSGCRMNEAVYRSDGSRIIYMRPPLLRVVEELDERHAAISSVAARLNVTLIDTEKSRDFNLIGIYAGDKKGNMRLRITATGGQLVLDMGTHDEIVDLWLPRKNRFFRGKVQDLLNNQSQLSLLAFAGGASDLFFPRAWTGAALERRIAYTNGREIVNVIEKPSIIRRRSRRLTMAPDTPTVEAVEVYDRFGREVGTIAYADYRFPNPDEQDAHAEGIGVVYPGRVILMPHDSVHRLDMQIEEVNINTEIDTAKFVVPVPENQKILDLGTALKRSGSLWE